MQQRSLETRKQILTAAQKSFSQSGYDATSVAEICQAAGVSKGAFYHHFPSKQALFLELLAGWLSRLDESFTLAWQETDDVPEAILQMAGMAGSLYQSTDVNLSIFLEFWTQAQRDPSIWKEAISPYRRYQEYFSDLIQQGITEGSLRQVNPEFSARVIVSLALGLLMQAMFDPEATDWELDIRRSFQLLLNGLEER
jgi:AcrR family transcriptional regulator